MVGFQVERAIDIGQCLIVFVFFVEVFRPEPHVVWFLRLQFDCLIQIGELIFFVFLDGAAQGVGIGLNFGVSILGASNLASRIAPATTVLYAKNLFNFVQLLVDATTKELKIDTGDELVQGTLLTMGGEIVHAAFKPAA